MYYNNVGHILMTPYDFLDLDRQFSIIYDFIIKFLVERNSKIKKKISCL
jgi:hypothetical protein